MARTCAGALLLCGCGGPQSALDPAGRDAKEIADLFWTMTAGAAVIWFAVVSGALYAAYFMPGPRAARGAQKLVVWGGIVVPTLLLSVLLIYGLAMLPRLLAPAPPGSLRVSVTGHQWWWRIRYFSDRGEPIHVANEVRLPVGTPVEFELESPDVIHSFWIPALGGKMDMIPGRRTRLRLEPTRTGRFRGVCAEYCGSSHALMTFEVVVEARDEFERWLARQAQPALSPTSAQAKRGQEALFANGCGACHAIRGTAADGTIGPDLTHIGSRLAIGAGTVPAGRESLRRFIAQTTDLKPGVHMPHFGMLSRRDLDALAAYLEELK